MVSLRCKQHLLVDASVNSLGIVYQFMMCDLSHAVGMKFWFSNQCRNVKSLMSVSYELLHFCLHHILLQFTKCLTLTNAYISSYMTFTAIVIFSQVSSGPLDLFFTLGIVYYIHLHMAKCSIVNLQMVLQSFWS